MSLIFKRYLRYPQDSFLLFGPRGTGKSTWIQENIPADLTLDLLESDRFLELSRQPSLLRSLCEPLKAGCWVVIDEIQKVPGLLDEVHAIYQKKNLRFAITGSSARKLKKTQANLLGGRLLDSQFFPLTSSELGEHFNLEQALSLGTLPAIALDYSNALPRLASYLTTYLRQELLEEAVIRNIDPFRRFLDIVGLSNGQLLNKEALGRESQVKRSTIDHYFGILEDTLIGTMIGSWNPGLKAKESRHPKFYLFDPGVVRACAGLLNQPLESEFLGFQLETLVLSQLRTYLNQTFKFFPLYHYTITGSYDIDFVIQTKKPVMGKKGELVCIEVKYGKKYKPEWCKGLIDFATLSKDHVVGKHILYCGLDRMGDQGVEIWPVVRFFDELFAGEIF
jgi:predicted AAA+ superfamily ATPase